MSSGNAAQPRGQPVNQGLSSIINPSPGRVYYYKIYASREICCVGSTNYSPDQIDAINGYPWPSSAGDTLHIIEDASPELVASLRSGKYTEDMLFREYLHNSGISGPPYTTFERVPPYLPFFSRQMLTVRWFRPVRLLGHVTQELDATQTAQLANGHRPLVLKYHELGEGYRELRTVSRATNVLRPWWSIPIYEESQCSEGYWEEVVTVCREFRNGSYRSAYYFPVDIDNPGNTYGSSTRGLTRHLSSIVVLLTDPKPLVLTRRCDFTNDLDFENNGPEEI